MRIIRSTSFRDLVSFFYENKCALTWTNFYIWYDLLTNLEAAHVQARFSWWPDQPFNWILFDKNIHRAFDKWFFTLTDEYKVKVHPKCESEFLKQYNDKSLTLPMDKRAWPHPKSIEWHRQHIYGLFEKSWHIAYWYDDSESVIDNIEMINI
jgi:putative restriction endonuclease